jgi:hypothetical protein
VKDAELLGRRQALLEACGDLGWLRVRVDERGDLPQGFLWAAGRG